MSAVETVTVDITSDEGVVALTIPAYTVPTEALRQRVIAITDGYLQLSRIARQPVSLGDFALHVLAHAANDPKDQPIDRDKCPVCKARPIIRDGGPILCAQCRRTEQ